MEIVSQMTKEEEKEMYTMDDVELETLTSLPYDDHSSLEEG